MWLLSPKAEAQTQPHTRYCAGGSLPRWKWLVDCAVGVCTHTLLLPHQCVVVQMLPAPCRKPHAILMVAAIGSWIFIDSRTQTRAECKHPVDASMYFKVVIELHASLITSHAITISEYPAESCDYLCFVPLHHYRNNP